MDAQEAELADLATQARRAPGIRAETYPGQPWLDWGWHTPALAPLWPPPPAAPPPTLPPRLPLPGEYKVCADRFEGVEWFPAKNNCPVLKQAIAYMECKVVSRMETPDHWITYCEVQDGSVLQPAARTAVHRRKVATYY
ncbi:hypothetical protein QJQ45_016761 [Haematococcus lacustris]|nr:hypothetical protein QJQ45_016761 [Haematococcus lacustris]